MRTPSMMLVIAALLAALAGCGDDAAPGPQQAASPLPPVTTAPADPTTASPLTTAPAPTSASPIRSPTPTFPPAVTSPEQGGVYFAVYLAVVKEGQSDKAAKAAEVSARAVGYETGTGEIGCEQGAREALGLDKTAGYWGTSIFFATAALAQQFVDAYEPGVVGTAKVTAFCLD